MAVEFTGSGLKFRLFQQFDSNGNVYYVTHTEKGHVVNVENMQEVDALHNALENGINYKVQK